MHPTNHTRTRSRVKTLYKIRLESHLQKSRGLQAFNKTTAFIGTIREGQLKTSCKTLWVEFHA